ncbi:baeRF11 domain-containing protein [Nocardia yamanashiensis]|uniref:baeRF11 domain-containing protein n=1 Tax=Nocardia yamanashiensis TaxID=209247 RepID=UPI00083053EF|nr:hypothetical protein [Nocardia yamanashiensis]
MLHTDIPTHSEILALARQTGPWCVTVYTPTEVDTPTPDRNRVAVENQVKQALDAVEDKEARAALAEEFADLLEDEDYWRFQSRTLAIFATPEQLITYRVPNRLEPATTVGGKFLVKPLLRTVTFPQAAYVLALSENAVRLVEITADQPAQDAPVPGLPANMQAYLELPPLGRNPHGRLQGSEGRKVRVRQYCRAVDQALRSVLTGLDIPLILAATEPTASLFRSVNTYPHLLDEGISGNPERLSDAELADQSRALLDKHYAAELAELRGEFEQRRSDGRGVIELSDIARAATYGIVHALFVDIDAAVPGGLADDGSITQVTGANGDAPGVLDEIARRTLLSGGRVLAVRAEDIPEGGPAAAILRYAP